MRSTRMLAVAFYAAAVNSVVTLPALSQVYPSRPIQMVVAYAAGGTGDIVARSISDKQQYDTG